MNVARFETRSVVWFAVFLAVGTFGDLLRAVDYISAVPGDLQDARFNSVILEHVFQWMTGRVESLWSPPFFYPFENALAFSDNHFGSSPVYIAFRLVGLSREIAFNAWFITGFVLNYVAAYVVARRLSLSPLAAAIGAFVFAFALPALAQEGHAQLTYRFAIPLAFGALLRMVEERRLRPIGHVAFWAAVQFYCSIYLGVFLVYLLAAAAVVAVARPQGISIARSVAQSLAHERLSAVVRAGALFIVSAGAVTLLLYKYKSVAASYGLAVSAEEVASMLPRMSSYLLADGAGLSSWLGRWVDGIPMRHEHQMFFGIGVVLLGVLGATWMPAAAYQASARRLAIGALVILIVLTLNVAGHSIYLALIELPGLSAVRGVTRIVLVMLWPIAILAGLGAERLLQTRARRTRLVRTFVLGMLPIAMVAEVAAYSPLKRSIAEWQARDAAIRKYLPAQIAPSSVLFVTRTAFEAYYLSELDAMIIAQDLGVPTLNGYSARGPRGLLAAVPCSSPRDRVLVYGVSRGWTEKGVDDVTRRVVLVERSECEAGAVSMFLGNVTAEQATGLRMRVESFDIAAGRFEAEVSLTNQHSEGFSTRNPTNSVAISWRFVPLGSDGQRLRNPGWDTRLPLSWTLKQGEARQAVIGGALPEKPGRYLIEVSMVQEGVAWLHDLGLRIPSVEVRVGASE